MILYYKDNPDSKKWSEVDIDIVEEPVNEYQADSKCKFEKLLSCEETIRYDTVLHDASKVPVYRVGTGRSKGSGWLYKLKDLILLEPEVELPELPRPMLSIHDVMNLGEAIKTLLTSEGIRLSIPAHNLLEELTTIDTGNDLRYLICEMESLNREEQNGNISN